LLIYDHGLQGLAGEREVAAFGGLSPMAAEVSGELCRLTLMQLLPALAEVDFVPFASALTRIQDAVGDHFAASQQGRYASPRVAQVLEWLAGEGVEGYGQSSWGPTGFAVLPDDASATGLKSRADPLFATPGGIELKVCRGRNTGAEVHIE
jgi:predicted sugar kinase